VPKLDLKKEYREFYQPSAKDFSVADVPEFQFLMIDGSGDPNTSQAYQESLETLYTMSYYLKFFSKNSLNIDYVVMPLEGLWWTADMAVFSMDDKSAWDWTAMIMQPAHLTAADVEAAAEEVGRSKNPPAIDRMRFEAFREGLSVQIMYFGPYADEGPTIARLHEFAADEGYRLRGKHHEIYLGDPRRTAPEKLRTVIRQPVESAA
jgi:hypothetical protein